MIFGAHNQSVLIATPSGNPPAGSVYWYWKSDGFLYTKNSAGVETKVDFDLSNNSTYRTLLDASGSHIAARGAGTYALGQGDPAAISGTGTLYPINTIYIDSADYPSVSTLTSKLRVRAQIYTNDVAPGGNYTFGLYPITRPATSGGAGLNIYTLGTVIVNSTVLFTAPGADAILQGASADFALPANGHYVIGFVSTAAVAASSHMHMSASLQMRNS